MSTKERLKLALKSIKASGGIDSDAIKHLTDDEKELVSNLLSEDLVEESLDFIENLNTNKEWELISRKIIPVKKPVAPLWKSVLKYAAVFIGLSAAIYFYPFWEKPVLKNQISEESIKLKTNDHTVKIIKQGESQQIATASGEVVAEQQGSTIRYKTDSNIDKLIYNELEIPNGKIFDIELSDGTMVHLNSGSKIRYPIKFLKNHKREVFINGEGYFKVTKDKDHPFVVHAGVVAVEVLGTEFNISSYKEDSEIKTVLVEGSVRMTNSNTPENPIVLKPGYKGALDKTSQTISMKKVDIALYTAWTKGELIFKNSTFENMSAKLERKYNVTIQNNNLLLKNTLLNAHFNVEIESIEDIMKSINKIYPFNYKIINNQKIIIN